MSWWEETLAENTWVQKLSITEVIIRVAKCSLQFGRQALPLLLMGKKEALQYEGVECIRKQVLYINTFLNGYKSNVSKLWELKLSICFHMDEKRRFFTEREPEALERSLRLTQSPPCRHQAQMDRDNIRQI